MKNNNAAAQLKSINRAIELAVANLATARTKLGDCVRTVKVETDQVFGPSGHCCRSVVSYETSWSDGYDKCQSAVRSAECDLEDIIEKKRRLIGRMGW